MSATANIVKIVYAAYQADRSVRYRLLEPWTLPPLVGIVIPGDYHGKFLQIIDGIITLFPTDQLDGATLAPERIGKNSAAEASIAHDILYLEMDDLAKAWDWPKARVRKLADSIFAAIMIQYSARGWVRVYYTAIRALGGIAHAVGKLGIILLFGLAIFSVAGCLTIPEPFGGVPAEPPVWEIVQ